MEFVMVPVPEEHAEELLAEVTRMSFVSYLLSWDEAKVTELLATLTDPQLRFLTDVAVHIDQDGLVPAEAVAERMEIDISAVLVLFEELEAACKSGSWPVLVFDADGGNQAPGEERHPSRFALPPTNARMVLDAIDGEASRDI